MKKITFLKIVLTLIVVISLVTFFKAICDDDEPAFDFLCYSNNFLLYACFLLVLLPCTGIFYADVNNFTYHESLVSYLATKEKSPPVSYL